MMSTRHQRPTSHSGYRFGQLSHSSFFTRHSPHATRVRHIVGLQGGRTICDVKENLTLPAAPPRPKASTTHQQTLPFPPSNFVDERLQMRKLLAQLPASATNVNSGMAPIDTLNGLRSSSSGAVYAAREAHTAYPIDVWHEELAALTEAATITLPEASGGRITARCEVKRPLYSAQTGRLMPPSSRCLTSRQSTRNGLRSARDGGRRDICDAAPTEVVFALLCQILQVNSSKEAKQWLLSACDREKALMLEIIRAAIRSSHELCDRLGTERPHDAHTAHKNILSGNLPPISEHRSGEAGVNILKVHCEDAGESGD